MLRRLPLAHRYRHVDWRAAAQDLQRGTFADTVASQEVEQVLGRGNRVAVQCQDYVADQNPCRGRRTLGGNAVDEECLVAVANTLGGGKSYRLAGDADIPALHPA